MCRKSLIWLISLVLGAVFIPVASADLILHWNLDEKSGAVANDSSGNGRHGTVDGTPDWVAGMVGGALDMDGSSDGITLEETIVEGTSSLAMWMMPRNLPYTSDYRSIFHDRQWNSGSIHGHLRNNTSLINFDVNGGGGVTATTVCENDEWYHALATWDTGSSEVNLYINGVLEATGTGLNSAVYIGPLTFGAWNSNRYFDGIFDDIRIYDHAVTADEVPGIMAGTARELAQAPSPEDGQVDVVRDATLAWAPGIYAGTHNLYVGESLEDVNNASVPTAGALDVNSFDVGRLEFDKVYYWRVDEVNATPDKTVYKGDIWSFTAEPYSIQIPGDTIGVAASSFTNQFSMPEKTIDGSGLGADDTHAIGPETMWFTAAVDLDPWIQYEFDGVKKLDIMKVWNSNSSAEIAIGWGVKDVVIEYSTDGENWESLTDAGQFNRAPGSNSYSQYDEVDFGGVAAQFVRLDIQSNWGGILMSYGLSEVQFYMIPAAARTPDPESGSTDVVPSTTVKWRAGRDAGQHTIYMGTDPNAVADGSAPSVTSNTNSLDLASLDLALGQTYYWRVDEVNEAEAVSVWQGPVWSLTTAAAVIVDDFDGYGNVSPDRPFQTWLDGYGYSADEFFPAGYAGNGSGAGAGHDIWSLSSPHYDGDIMEGTIVVGGSGKSLPIYYDNASGPSHVDRTLAPAQNWSANGIQTLGLSFFGDASNSGQLYLEINGTKVTYDLDADALKQAEWQFWAIDLASVGVNLQAVTSLSIGVQGSGSGLVYVDNMALYARAIEYIEPVEPGTENLVAQYSFEGNYGDSSGNGNTLTEVGGVAIVNDAERGNVAVFNGLDAALQVPLIGEGTSPAVTLTTWVRLDIEHNATLWSVYHSDAWTEGDMHAHIGGDAQFQVGVNGMGGNLQNPTSANVGQWYHLAYVAGPDAVALYVNGVLSRTAAGDPDVLLTLGEGTLGAWSNGAMERFLTGAVDDVRIYTEALSAEEIAGIAGRSTMYKPF